MDNELSRRLSVLADGEPVTGFRRARLTGQAALGLFPMPLTLRLWNLAEAEYYRLCAAKEIAVRAEDSVLAAGAVSDVCRKTVPEGTVTEIVFSAGLKLWEAPVSLSVEAGEGLLLLRTRITGWPLGKTVRIKWKDGSLEGLVLERSVNADNLEGEWVSKLLLERVV